MKKNLLIAIALIFSFIAHAKKVKFSVDMTGQTVSVNGVHVAGDFQVLAGYPGDFESGTTTLTLEDSTTNIYSIVVDLPAFAKYEYKFINGDQWYEAEFVPVESRVGYNFNDNRWIYVDSTADDTTNIGAVLFAANAPVGYYLVRFYVDMQNEMPVDPQGAYVHFNTGSGMHNSLRMYNFDSANQLYEIIGFTNASTTDFRFSKGGAAETVPSTCSNIDGDREVTVNYDSLLANFCFGECQACLTGIHEPSMSVISLYPNPTTDYAIMDIGSKGEQVEVIVTDITGKIAGQFNTTTPVRIERNGLQEGVYSVYVITQDHHQFTGRFILK